MLKKTFAAIVLVGTVALPFTALAETGYGGSTPTPSSGGGGGNGAPFGLAGESFPGTGSVGGGQVLGAAVFQFTTNLHEGMISSDVTQLQTLLIKDGYLHINPPTGYFGSLTLAAVKEYQTAHKIPDTGFVGPLTRAALNQEESAG